MIDSGAEGSAFISESLAHRLRLPCRAMDSPCPISAFDGRVMHTITHTATFPFTISPGHHELLTAFIVPLVPKSLILDVTWL